MRHPLPWLLCLVLAIALAPTIGAEEGFRPLKIGERVPALAMPDLKGGQIKVGEGEPLTLLNVWATWCGPCRQEFPELQGIHDDYRARGLRVVAVSIDAGSREPVRRFVALRKVTFRIGHDANSAVPRVLQTVGVPETFLIDRDGRLLWHKAGALRNGATDARAAIDAALVMPHLGGRPVRRTGQ